MNDRNQFRRSIAPSAIQLAICDLIVAHLSFDATMVAAMAAGLNALLQYFIDDDLTNLRPAPLGKKSGIGEPSGELPEPYV